MTDQPDKLRSSLIWAIKVVFRILRQPLQYLARHKRCLIVVAVILIVFGALNYADLPVKEKKESVGNKWWQTGNELIEEIAPDLNLGIMGGALNLTASAIPVAQASIDFSADDELENQDLAIMEGSGLLSPEMSGNAFFGMQKAATYVVQSGDSPFSIAIKFGINTDTVLAANNLRDGDYIKPGQTLTILPINGVRVKVVAKETFASLAKKYKGKVEEIKAFNGIYEDSKLVVGNFIIIPDGELPTPVVTKPKITAPKYASTAPAAGAWLIIPTIGKDWGRVHGQNGVDVANACGTPIYAAAAGTVILSDGIGWNFGYGKYIMIRHANGVVTVYGHASQLIVEQGQQVDQGQLIALMGSTGRSTGCHLHFEVRGAKNPLAGAKTIR